MVLDDYSLYETLYHHAINPDILGLIPGKLNQVRPFYNDGYILDCDRGKMFLQVYRGREACLACQIQILTICRQQGSPHFLFPLFLTDGRSYAKLDEERWFYITLWPEMQNVRFRSTKDLLSLVNLLAGFRKIWVDNGFLYCLPEHRAGFNLWVKFKEVLNRLDSFRMLAKHRLHPTIFDRRFLKYLPVMIDQTKQAIEILEKTDYRERFASLTLQDIIINNLTRHNLRISGDGRAVCLQLADYHWDLPIIDLAILLIKSGRSSKWDIDWFRMIRREYEKYFVISEPECQVIRAYLCFPWSLYHLAARYYYNRVDWPLRLFVEKMERLLADEVNRMRLVKNWNEL